MAYLEEYDVLTPGGVTSASPVISGETRQSPRSRS
ncbi:hypothetical protein OJF2_40570 [Aquisphaera giovannonii]|uniref:Uncharacterized protein n=1 Tax=Aquisphaera giovannonii TaxID=406548 RepID=A0A5B9W5W0_9BACT|nr:hypothetical protein OJF2_40570 [Aquisphaera giovannonii]